MNYPTLRNIINSNLNGATIINIDTVTPVTLRGGKKNPQQGRIFKQVIGSNVMIFQNKNIHGYQAMVQRRLIKEGKNVNFELSPRKWGTRIENEPFVVHTKDGYDYHYFEVIFLKAGEVTYFEDGKVIDKKDIVGLNQSYDGEQGGLNDKVIIRTYSVDSIVGLRMNKVSYDCDGDVEQVAV